MAFFATRYREEMAEPIAREFDGLNETLKSVFFREHNEDGTHNFDPDERLNATVQSIIDQYQASGQWWKQGPWHLNTPADGGELANRAIIRPPDPATGTYHDYQPPGIDTAIGMSIEPTGDITITGIYNADITKERMFFLRNRDSSATITLKHEDSGSLEAYQFQLPNDTDVVIGPRENVWLFYDSDRERWTYTITQTQSGGISAGAGPITTVQIPITELQLESGNTSPIQLVAATTGKIHFPLWAHIKIILTTGYSSSPVWSLRHGGQAPNLTGTINPTLTGAATTTYHVIGGLNTISYSASPINKSLVLFLNGNPTGAGSATAVVELTYQTTTDFT